MAFDPALGLVFIPAQETAQVFALQKDYKPVRQGWNTAVAYNADGDTPLPPSRAYLLAWDPVNQRAAWRAPLAVSGGGALATAGGLVFQGNGQNHLSAYRSATGERVWHYDVQGTAMAAPITYAVGGVQYLAVLTGCGGDFADQCAGVEGNRHPALLDRLLVFRLGGKETLPARPEPYVASVSPDMARIATPRALVAAGARHYDRYCVVCHGVDAVSAGLNPDLRMSGIVPSSAFYKVVLGGALKDGGMPSFAGELTRQDAKALQAYIAARAKAANAR